MVFAGDLAPLTQAHLDSYRSLFNELKRLQTAYNIYDFFEFSGVPSAPTKTDWQWWGELNEKGYGAVVVVRGDGGDPQRSINIPWAADKTIYEVQSLLNHHMLGRFSGSQLQAGAIHLALLINGQEILELSPVPHQQVRSHCFSVCSFRKESAFVLSTRYRNGSNLVPADLQGA